MRAHAAQRSTARRVARAPCVGQGVRRSVRPFSPHLGANPSCLLGVLSEGDNVYVYLTVGKGSSGHSSIFSSSRSIPFSAEECQWLALRLQHISGATWRAASSPMSLSQ